MADWLQAKRQGMTKRIACRLYLFCKQPPSGIKIQDVMEIAFGIGQGMNKIKNPPAWWKQMDAELPDYDPHWIDWNSDEKKFVVGRLISGMDRGKVKSCLSIPDTIYQECIRDSMVMLSNKQDDLSQEPKTVWAKKDSEEELDYESFINEKLAEYGERISLKNPVNKATVISMILLETKIEEIGRKLLNTTDIKDIASLAQTFATLREQYSNSAEDVAQLEKQQDIKKEGETFDDAMEHITNLLPEWRNRCVDLLLEESGLIKHTVQLHKVDLFADTLKGELKDKMVDTKRKADIMGVKTELPLIMREDFDGGSEDIAVTE